MSLFQTVLLASQHVPSENGGPDELAVVGSVSLGFSRDMQSALKECERLNDQINEVGVRMEGPVNDFLAMLGRTVPGHCAVRAIVTSSRLSMNSFPLMDQSPHIETPKKSTVRPR